MKKLNYIFKIFTAQILTIVILLAFIELAGKTYAYFNPGYENLYAIPDRVVGWRLTPNLEYIHTGSHWYENEFRVKVKHNSLGFRDDERSVSKPHGVTRIALLGDSSVSARQVAFKNTSGQTLEKLLNQNSRTKRSKIYEVLNFGVDGIGVGQSFLTYRQYASAFDPDYVFLFVFEGDIWRTVFPQSAITDKIGSSRRLSIRPVFNINAPSESKGSFPNALLKTLNFSSFYKLLNNLDKKETKSQVNSLPTEEEYVDLINSFKILITEKKIAEISKKLQSLDLLFFAPKQNIFDEFLNLQADKIKGELGGNRTKVRAHEIFLVDLWGKLEFGLSKLKEMAEPELRLRREFDKLIKAYRPKRPDLLFGGNDNFSNFESVIFVNLKVLESLNRDIVNAGKKFIIVDASSHIIKHGRLPANLLSDILQKYCKVNDIGYIALSQTLNDAKISGIQTLWPKDGHFNENGQRIFGEAMFEWIKES